MAEKNKGGRPSAYKEEYTEQAYKLCLLGATDKELAFFFDVDVLQIENWLIDVPQFHQAIVRAMQDYPEYLRKKQEKKEKRKQYRKQPHIKKQANEYMKNKVKTDIKYKIRSNVSSLVRSRLKGKNKTGIFQHLGYSVEELSKHLESKFVDEMSWENYGKVWHIDHIKPDKLFHYESVDDEDFRKCWELSNLQPLFAEDNLRKGSKYAG